VAAKKRAFSQPPTRIIALGGRSGVGKDTLGEELARQAGYRPIAFAQPLYEAVAKKYRVTVSFLKAREFKDRECPILYGASPRRLLQAEGDRLRKDEGVDALINRLKAEIGLAPAARFVITDLRLQREVDAVHEMGGVVVRVMAGEALCSNDIAYGARGAAAAHPTEADEFEPDLTVVNTWGYAAKIVYCLLDSLRRPGEAAA